MCRKPWLLCLSVSLVACGARSELDTLNAVAGVGGNASGSGAGGNPATGGNAMGGTSSAAGSSATCPGTGGPTMIALPLGYCIDSTEVTEGQYQTWLSTNPSAADQPDECSWNIDFTPTGNWPPSADSLNYPVTYVNWCDAYAYCAGAGKRLCGKIAGGSNGPNDYRNAALSQWYAACTSNGAYDANGYPYGEAYEPTACNTQDYWGDFSKCTTLPVASLGTCQSSVSGYSGVFDLSGNVWEWEDSCEMSEESEYCLLRGGAFIGGGDQFCGFGLNGTIDLAYDALGFRCCFP